MHGFYDGVGGVFYKPVQGAKKDGALGFVKGCGRGLSGLVTEPISGENAQIPRLMKLLLANDKIGAFGVLGYTGKGVIRSLDKALHQKIAITILEAKQAEGVQCIRRQLSCWPQVA